MSMSISIRRPGNFISWNHRRSIRTNQCSTDSGRISRYVSLRVLHLNQARVITNKFTLSLLGKVLPDLAKPGLDAFGVNAIKIAVSINLVSGDHCHQNVRRRRRKYKRANGIIHRLLMNSTKRDNSQVSFLARLKRANELSKTDSSRSAQSGGPKSVLGRNLVIVLSGTRS